MNKAKITFRFDHEHNQSNRGVKQEPKVIPLHTEEYRIVEDRLEHAAGQQEMFTLGRPAPHSVKPGEHTLIDAQQLNANSPEFGGWQSSFDIETQRVEQIIRSTKGAAVDPETGYIDPERREDQGQQRPESEEELRDHRWYTPQATSYYTRNGNGSWLKITTSVAGAVVTGVAFGFLVLSMFSGGDEAGKGNPVDGPPPAQQTQGLAKPGEAGKQTDTAVKPASEPTAVAASTAPSVSVPAAPTGVAMSIPAKSYTFLQGGVFSTAQSAETAAADFKKKGIAAAAESGDKFPVYVGMAMSRDEALGLSAQFKQKKIDVIFKPYDIPEVNKIKWNGKHPEPFQNYMNQGDKLVLLVSAQTTAHIGEAKPTPLDEKALQTIKTTHQSWSGFASAVSEGLAEPGKSVLPKMNNALSAAVVALEEYKKSPSAAFLWQAQTAMMQYLIAEKELLKAAAAQ